jgi:hypothetical protein
MAYTHIPQEDPHYCVPASLQMVLQSRGIPFDSQQKIYSELGGKGPSGVKLTEGGLEKHFKEKGMPLHCVDFMADKSFCRDFDSFADAVLSSGGDILVNYAVEELYDTEKEANHVSLVIARRRLNLVLLDPAGKKEEVVVPFSKFERAIFKAGGGFHCMHPDPTYFKKLPHW